VAAAAELVGAPAGAGAGSESPAGGLDFDHLPRLVELPFHMGEFLAQADHLALARIRLSPPSFLGQDGQGALIALLTPLADQGRIEALAPEQGTLARLAQALVLAQDLLLVEGAEAPQVGPLRHIRVGLLWGTHGLRGWHRREHSCHVEPSPCRPLSSSITAGRVSHSRLTRRV
jgi:hypothetical protein